MSEPRVVRDTYYTKVQTFESNGQTYYDIWGPVGSGRFAQIGFQSGPIAEVGVNGCQNEDLLAIIIDRLRSFQSGEFACRENAIALTHLETALLWLEQRTRDRQARGVEGKNEA